LGQTQGRHYVTNEEVAACYLDAYEYAAKSGVIITFENHVDMWSEDYRRVLEVADLVEARGVPFNMAMDYSHCIFKIENEVEHAVSQMRGDNEAIAMLDPFNSDSYADQWLSRNLVHWAQMRPAAPNGPLNWWGFETGPWDAKGIDRPGRSIQYPFERPAKGEWHTDMWHAHKLACTKEVTRKVIDAYLQSDDTSLSLMTIDNINLNAYGLGWKYNMFADSCAYANFVRELYAERAAVHQARSAVSPTEFVAQYRAHNRDCPGHSTVRRAAEGIFMHAENSFVIDDWYPVGALAETVSGRKYHTRILGRRSGTNLLMALYPPGWQITRRS
jgi:hypothetical protein